MPVRWHEILRSAPVSSSAEAKHPQGADKAFLELVANTSLARSAYGRGLRRVTIVGDPAKFAAYASTKYGRGSGRLSDAAARGDSAARAFLRRYESNARRGYPLIFRRTSDLSLTEAESNNATVTVARTSKACSHFVRSIAATSCSRRRALRAGKYKIDAAFAEFPFA